MSIEFTDRQKQAIASSGDSLIVSAAAGSGKTAVLSERVANILCDAQRRVSPDSLLVLTFTEAAAEQMKNKITEKMRARLAADPKNAFLRGQLLELPCAKIGTIHSACYDLIRQNFEALGIDPQFSVADDSIAVPIRERLADEFIEELYGRAANDPETDWIMNCFDADDEKKLRDNLHNACVFVENEPFPEAFYENLEKRFSNDPFEIMPDAAFKDQIEEKLSEAERLYEGLVYDSGNENDPEHYAKPRAQKLYADHLGYIREMLDAVRNGDYGGAYRTAQGADFNGTGDSAATKADKERVKEYKKIPMAVVKEYFALSAEEFAERHNAGLKAARWIIGAALEFEKRLESKMAELKIVSFSQAERLALRLLTNPDGTRTELAEKTAERISEITVDEAQDCSRIQDCIFAALSKDGKNLFKVGDVKQSIYKFRSAYPQLFIDLLAASERTDRCELTAPSRIDLAYNFRSHEKIVTFVNSVFSGLMADGRGGVDYSDGHELKYGKQYENVEQAEVKFTLVLTENGEKTDSLLEAEAETVAEMIAGMIGNKDVYDPETKTVRKAKASDVALLLRAPGKVKGGAFENALRRHGVGVLNSNKSANCLERQHVHDLIAYLKVIDDPYEDIPLITVLHSGYCGFTVADLGRIRAAKRNATLYEALCEYAKTNGEAAEFVSELATLRDLAQVSTVYELINAIFERSGVLLRTANMQNGDDVRGDLMTVAELAAEFESVRYRGLFAFLEYLKSLQDQDKYQLPGVHSGSADCVNLMSIHKSKGLEFPIVFLSGVGTNVSYFKAPTLVCDTQGNASAKVADSRRHFEYTSPDYDLMLNKLKKEDTDEAIRLLYVALTRAKTHLYVTAAATREKAAAYLSPDADITKEPWFFKWVTRFGGPLPQAFAELAGVPYTGGEIYEGETVEAKPAEDAEPRREERAAVVIPADKVSALLSRRYAYEQSVAVPAKLSVSEIKNNATHATYKVKPRFMTGASGADRGTATHRFLQFCDFAAVTDERSLDAEIERLKTDGFITESDAELTDRKRVLRFLQSERMKALGGATLHKEQRFLFTLPAREVTELDSDEPVVVQGVIDCWYETPDGAVILDYKTDAVKTADELTERYRVQLEMYQKAVERLYGVRVTQKLIYSFALERFIEV